MAAANDTTTASTRPDHHLPPGLPEQLSSCSLPELLLVFEAFEFASDAFQAFYNQPRTEDGEVPQAVIDREMQRAQTAAEQVATEARRRVPVTSSDLEARASIAFRFAMWCGGFESHDPGLGVIAQLADRAMADPA